MEEGRSRWGVTPDVTSGRALWLQAYRPASDFWQFAVGSTCWQMVDRMKECLNEYDIWERDRVEIVQLGRGNFKKNFMNTILRRGRRWYWPRSMFEDRFLVLVVLSVRLILLQTCYWTGLKPSRASATL